MTTTTLSPGNPLTKETYRAVEAFFSTFSRPWWRYTAQKEESALSLKQFGTPELYKIQKSDKSFCPTLWFNTYLNPENKKLQPSNTCIMIDIDTDSALDKLGVVNHLQLRDTAQAIINTKGIPAIVFASASGKTKIAVAVRVGTGRNCVHLTPDEQKAVMSEALNIFGWSRLNLGNGRTPGDIDASNAGMNAFGISNTVGLHSSIEEVRAALDRKSLDMVPVILEHREAYTKTLEFRFTLDTVARTSFLGLSETCLDILEFSMALAKTAKEGNPFHISQLAMAKTLEVSVATVSRSIKTLVERGILKKETQGNNYKGQCSTYMVSERCWDIIKFRQETERLRNLRSAIGNMLRKRGETTPSGEGSSQIALMWLQDNAPLAQGIRFANTPAWVGTLRKAGCSPAEVVELLMENDQGIIPEERSTWEARVRCLWSK